MFDKVLIANRGEIAIRVIRACRELGLRSVAVYSDADRSALHVQMADEAVRLGPPPARESYLRGDIIIQAALEHKAGAIHPGYGFLAENGDFAEMVEQAGLVWVGPPASAIRAMGSKTDARRMMAASGVPVVPGGQSGLIDLDAALKSAENIGYPVLIKAAKGGGGKGMRIVNSAAEFPSAFDGARREALSAFGDDEVYLEKFILGPRHIEIQILADKYGNCVHLFERECSIQRRHQKVVEESPSPALNDRPDIRLAMGAAAAAAAQACGYVNAGTVEFLFVPATKNFYFLEMNTRLQVEHPVTELVTGIDIVQTQLRIAQGETLPFKQRDLVQRGHSIECRIYAEDPANNFLPDAGRIRTLIRPDGPWVRVDSGVTAGDEVGIYYDPLVAKLITWGADRPAAIDRMQRALSEYRITGFKTTIPFSLWMMQQPRFRRSDFDTRFIEQEFKPEALHSAGDDGRVIAAALAAALTAKNGLTLKATPPAGRDACRDEGVNPWKAAGRRQAMR